MLPTSGPPVIPDSPPVPSAPGTRPPPINPIYGLLRTCCRKAYLLSRASISMSLIAVSRRPPYRDPLHDAERRQRVQEEFLAGQIAVMVATIAFGMGIDKPDIRTAIHTALPGSLK